MSVFTAVLCFYLLSPMSVCPKIESEKNDTGLHSTV